MKKIISVILALVSLFTVCACTQTPENPYSTSQANTPVPDDETAGIVTTAETDLVVEDNYVMLESDKVADDNIESIEIMTLPALLDYYIGDEISLDGLALRIYKKDGKKGLKRSDFSYAPRIVTKDSGTKVTITYKTLTVSYDINVLNSGDTSYKVDNAGPAIVSLIKKNYPNNGHPRIIMTAERFSYVEECARGSTLVGKEYRNLKQKANNYLSQAVQTYQLPDGLRLLSISRTILDVVYACSFAYQITGQEKFAERAAKELDAAANFPDWHPYHFLDTGEMCAAFGIGFDWLYSYLSEERRNLYIDKIINYGFEAALDDYLNRPRKRTYDWYHDTPGDNWKLVNNGGLGLAAMAVCDEAKATSVATKILSFGYESSYEFIRNAYMELDGSYVESLGYWSYATEFLAYYASALESSCGTTFDLTDWEGLRKTGYFPSMLSGNTFISFNFGDASESFMSDWAMLWLGHQFNNNDFAEFRLKYIRQGKLDIHDILFLYPEINNNVSNDVELPLDYGSLDATNATFRTGWGNDDMFVGIHYGKNAVPHGHSDMGQFILEYKNVRFFSDLGSDDYNLPSYGTCYRHVAEGHNTLVINNGDKATDQKQSAETYISNYKSTENEAFAVADMTSAYNASKVARGLKLLRDTSAVVLQDEIKAASASQDIYWFAHTKASVQISDDGKVAHLALQAARIKAVILGDGVFTKRGAETSEWSQNQNAGQASNSSFSRLTINVTGKTEYTICVVFVPEDSTAELPALTPLSEWN
ncbi:MAG: heparinase II/III family protein [Clostridia bacterium]|nr:heparinase II/III family protein [Clostridia bacterium]